MNLPKDVTVMSSDWTSAATSILLAVSSVIAANHHSELHGHHEQASSNSNFQVTGACLDPYYPLSSKHAPQIYAT